LRQVGGFFQGTRVSSTNKTGRIKLTVTKQEGYCFVSTDRHDVTEILLKVALNTITLTRFNGNTSMLGALTIHMIFFYHHM
jgi:hypothetical protein